MNNFTSMPHDETTFYQSFLYDLRRCKNEAIIESPFITTQRMKMFIPVFSDLIASGVSVYVVTRNPDEHSDGYEAQSEQAVRTCERLGVQVLLCTGNHHRKLAILDRKILWEGSLNILSQSRSREIMRRLEGGGFAEDMIQFLRFERYI